MTSKITQVNILPTEENTKIPVTQSTRNVIPVLAAGEGILVITDEEKVISLGT